MTQAESPRTKGGTRQTMTCILVLVAGMERQAVVNWRQGTRKRSSVRVIGLMTTSEELDRER